MSETNYPKSFLIEALDEARHTDAKFQCPNEEDPTTTSIIQAHQTILILASPVFEKMFCCDESEKFVTKKDIIEVTDIHANAFKSLIDIIYGKDITIDSRKWAVELYYAGDKYDIKGVFPEAEKFLKDQLEEIENIIPIYELCVAYGNHKWEENCIELLMSKTELVLLDASFLICQPKTFLKIFNLKSLYIDSEMRLLEAYIKYLEINENAKDDIQEALKSIRFLTIEPRDLVRINFFTDSELVRIIRIGSNHETEKEMPLDLSTTREDRCTKISRLDGEITKLIRKFSTSACCRQHTFTSCWRASEDLKQKFTEVYKKYSHLNFHTYSPEDFEELLKIYQDAA